MRILLIIWFYCRVVPSVYVTIIKPNTNSQIQSAKKNRSYLSTQSKTLNQMVIEWNSFDWSKEKRELKKHHRSMSKDCPQKYRIYPMLLIITIACEFAVEKKQAFIQFGWKTIFRVRDLFYSEFLTSSNPKHIQTDRTPTHFRTNKILTNAMKIPLCRRVSKEMR